MLDRAATFVIAVLYPVAVFVTIRYFSITALGGVTLAVGGLRLLLSLLAKKPAQPLRGRVDLLGVLLVLIGCAILWSQDAITARFYPVIVNLGLLSYFAWSLLHPPTVIYRIAELTEPDLPDSAVAYTTRVTAVWCGFFLVNASIAFYTAVWASLELWTLYNGLLAYLAMGILFAAEYLVRRRVRSAAGD